MGLLERVVCMDNTEVGIEQIKVLVKEYKRLLDERDKIQEELTELIKAYGAYDNIEKLKEVIVNMPQSYIRFRLFDRLYQLEEKDS